MYALRDDRGYYLSEGTKSRGSAAGIGRIVTTESGSALRWSTEAEARAVLAAEFDRCDVESYGWSVVEVPS